MVRALLLSIICSLVAGSAFAARTIDFAANPEPDDALIVAISDPSEIADLASVLGEEGAAALQRAAERVRFKGASGETDSFVTGAERFGEIHLVGVGKEPLKPRDIEDFGGVAGGLADKSKAARVSVIPPRKDAETATYAAFGAALGQYDFEKYKKAGPKNQGEIIFIVEDAQGARQAWNSEKRHVAEAVLWARDMQSEPGNVLYPEEFVERARRMLRGVSNVSVNVLDVAAMERLGMNSLLSVGQGSARPPRLLVIEYRGGTSGEAPIALVGKGITFDTGGISLKRNDNMWMMKADMTGAAVVAATAMGLAKSGAPVNVVAVAALAENMPSDRATRPGDIYRAMSGTTIEIMSTDAEGRLVLADAVWYVQEQYKPSILIDVATLTGAISSALSDEYGGLFVRDDAIGEKLLSAGKASGEELWRMPLHPNYYKQIRSNIADIKNSDAGSPGHGVGAAFIGTFIKDETPWAHLDIANVDYQSDSLPTVPRGFSGFGVRLLDRFARDEAAR